MKAKISFLFFLCINFICVQYDNIFSQDQVDSTLFYYKSITELKDVSLTIKAFDFFEKKVQMSLSKKDSISAAYYLELISLGQFKMGFYYESEATTIKALDILKPIAHQQDIIKSEIRLKNQLGMLYGKIDDYENALRFYNQALKISVDSIDKIAIITNIANIDADQNRYQKAVEKLNPYYLEASKITDYNVKSSYFDNLGYYQCKIGKIDGLKNIKFALDIRKKTNDLIGIFSSYRHLSYYYSDIGNHEKAKLFAKKAKIISNKINSPTYELEAIGLNLRLESNSDFEKYIDINNNLNKARQVKENKYAAIKYNIDESEKNLKEIQLQNERQEKLKLIYLFLGLTVLLISFFVILVLRSRHKKEKVQQVLKTETRISKKVHDEVANDLYQVMTKLQSGNDKKEVVLDDLEGIYNKTRDISKENSSVDIKTDYNELINDLLLGYKTDDINVVTRNVSKINWNTISAIKKTTLHRVLQELMTNMCKHSKASNAVLTFNQTKSKITIEYRDNGVGCVLKKQNGLQNVENRIESIKGTITFESQPNDGFKAKIIV